MTRFTLLSALFVASISIIIYCVIPNKLYEYTAFLNYRESLTENTISTTITGYNTQTTAQDPRMIKNVAAMSKSILRNAIITPHRSAARGHHNYGWLDTYHSFSFSNWNDPNFDHFGSLRVLNEDSVKANSGFPTHPHRDFEIFTYMLSGELTHRDSMLAKGQEGTQSDKFYRMHRGDVQFTTGGTGIAHSEFNEHKTDTAHFLQIWAVPWKKGLTPRYHTKAFTEEDKRKAFVKILSPLKAGEDATAKEEAAAEPTLPNTIPIHADFVMGAGIIAPNGQFEWKVGGGATKKNKRKVYVHLPRTKSGTAKIRVDGRETAELVEGDGAFIDGVNDGDTLSVESIGEAEAEVVVLDTEGR